MNKELEAFVATASPGKLVLMLYARALKDLKDARDLFDLVGDPRSQIDAIHLIIHAQQIITELSNCVNEKHNIQDLAANLKKIYEYIQYRLTEAIVKRDKKSINEVIGLLTELHDAWDYLVKSLGITKGD